MQINVQYAEPQAFALKFCQKTLECMGALWPSIEETGILLGCLQSLTLRCNHTRRDS